MRSGVHQLKRRRMEQRLQAAKLRAVNRYMYPTCLRQL